jgi:predicted Zn-dependent peptidase
MEFKTHVLQNGIRVIHIPVNSLIAHAGILINTGSRDEDDCEHGMAHFLEHVIFKGTQKRKSYHIISRLEDVGGELNAYTTKEETCIHASFLKEDYERTIELIADILLHSTFPEKEVEKEKEVIVDEINSYKDNPSELIFDDFDELLFPKSTIGRSILGTPEILKTFTREKAEQFLLNKYYSNQMVFCTIGDISFNRLIKLTSKYFEKTPFRVGSNNRTGNFNNKIFNKEKFKKTYQTHCVIGNQAYSLKDDKRITLHLLNNILGGPGMNSRLNMSLREKNGCTYNIESNYSAYTDTGIFSVYFGTDKENLEKSLALTHKELMRIRNQKLGGIQLAKAKKQLIGQLAIASENNENLMLSIAKSLLVFDKVDTLEEINRQIEAITAEQLIEIANEILDPNNLSTLIYK